MGVEFGGVCFKSLGFIKSQGPRFIDAGEPADRQSKSAVPEGGGADV